MAELKHEVKPEGIAETAPQYVPTIYFEVSEEQMELLAVGADLTVTLKGKVVGLESSRMEEDGQYEVRVELQETIIDPEENAFAELAEDE